MTKLKLPTISELAALVRAVKLNIRDDYRIWEEDTIPGVQLTIGWNPDTGEWDYQTGDNSFSGPAYRYHLWAVVDVYRRSNSRALARDIRRDFEECFHN